MNCIHTSIRGGRIYFQTIVLYRCNSANSYDILFLHKILWAEEAIFMCQGVFNVHNSHIWARYNIILMEYANMGIKSASASVFGLELSGTLPLAPTWYVTGRLPNDVVIFWKLFYQDCLKMCL
jgi:hypothetical protein